MTVPICLRRLSLAALLCLSLPVQALQMNGRLEWVQRVELRALDDGQVSAVLVKPGQHVQQGEVLLRMDARAAEARQQAAHAQVARAQAELADAQRELDRTQELFDRGLIAIEELKDAELQQIAATAEVAAAQAEATAAEVALEHTELSAPFDAIVVERNVEQGALIYRTLQPRPLLAVAPNDRMLARILVTSDVLRRYRPGEAAKVRVRGELRDAEIYSLGVEAVRIDPDGAVYELDVIFASDPDKILRPSEFVQVMLP
ncbi:efflux RND transporter periplasmic adaptor subunit [Rhabdochromatium marinum]|uniref:efflux RND transporter periplasmic adaptor subunit n=1 Tax=Rhabdochromatium marinum TaxID=48729 RepID=UPI0019072E93|nr:efflux RND transporter periplasmic adaptor subunit [Rhabdochromatium marinum]MBK1649654.1 efflux transporter periplasmic adaptor subunit [Rhabdochromatium marinum]